jgi:nitrous oxide reductase
MQMFRLVKNTATAIDWFTKPGHTVFGKHKLRQIKYLMGDLSHPHIFTSMLASTGQYLNFLILTCVYF